MYFFITLSTAIALSLDAFSLAIIYGSVLERKKVLFTISLTVGIFHFFMPLLGFLTSNLLIVKLISNTDIISFFIFLFLGLEMLFSKNDNQNLMNLSSFLNIILFAFTVSIDSFSVGIAISSRQEMILFPIIMFSLVSFLFTHIGLSIGKKLNNFLGNVTTRLGGIILIILSFYYLLT